MGHEFASYAVVLAAALIASGSLFLALAPRTGLARGRATCLVLVAVVSGLIGAKLTSVLLEGAKLFSMVGFTFMGSLALGCPAVLVAARLLRLPIASTLDLSAVAAALGLAIGRIGCVLAGCCWGKPTLFPIALVYGDFAAAARPIGVPLHAVPAFEALGAFALFILLLGWLCRRCPAPGLVAACFFAAYAALRFSLEFLRADPRGPELLGLSPPQIACCALLVLAGIAAKVTTNRGTVNLAVERSLVSDRVSCNPAES